MPVVSLKIAPEKPAASGGVLYDPSAAGSVPSAAPPQLVVPVEVWNVSRLGQALVLLVVELVVTTVDEVDVELDDVLDDELLELVVVMVLDDDDELLELELEELLEDELVELELDELLDDELVEVELEELLLDDEDDDVLVVVVTLLLLLDELVDVDVLVEVLVVALVDVLLDVLVLVLVLDELLVLVLDVVVTVVVGVAGLGQVVSTVGAVLLLTILNVLFCGGVDGALVTLPPAAPPKLTQYVSPLLIVKRMPPSLPGFGGTTVIGWTAALAVILMTNVPFAAFLIRADLIGLLA